MIIKKFNVQQSKRNFPFVEQMKALELFKSDEGNQNANDTKNPKLKSSRRE